MNICDTVLAWLFLAFFKSMIQFYNSSKRHTIGFLVILGNTDLENWPEMD